MDAYRKGLNSCQAVWAAKKYRGHRVIPASILADLEKARLWIHLFLLQKIVHLYYKDFMYFVLSTHIILTVFGYSGIVECRTSTR